MALVLVLHAGGCSTLPNVKNDPFYESFYKTARLIMTDQEKEIYKILADREAKAEFIAEFWKIRDPDPGTEENENKIEFEERIRFANEWFDKYKSSGKGLRKGASGESRGWESERGRIYIILGPPDQVNYGSGWEPMDARRQNLVRNKIEIWYYSRYDLTVGFYRKGFAEQSTNPFEYSELDATWRDHQSDDWIMGLNSRVLYALEDAKLNMISSEFRRDINRSFRFEAEFKNNMITLTIPAHRVNFLEEDGKLKARFDIKINIYKDNKKIDVITDLKSLSLLEEELVQQKEIIIEIPCPLTEKGKYLLDIIMSDHSGGSLSKYRLNIKHKI